MQFAYRCLDAQGISRDGVLDSSSAESARAELERRKWTVQTLKPVGVDLPLAPPRPAAPAKPAPVPAASPAPPLETRPDRVKPREVAIFTLQLAAMMRAQVPITRALASLAQPGRERLNPVVTQMAREIDEGCSFSHALSRYPRTFDQMYHGMVLVGEQSGGLVEILGTLGEFLRRSEDRRSRLIANLTYPIFVMGSSLAMALFMLVYMLPRFLDITQQHGGELPWLTRVVMLGSKPWLVGTIVGALALAALWWLRVRNTPTGRALRARLLYQTPPWGKAFQLHLLNRLCRSLALMFQSGITVNGALRILLQAGTGYPRMDETLNRVLQGIVGGESMSRALRQEELFPPLLVGMVAIGEASGRLDRMLAKYAEITELDLDLQLDSLLQLVEPVVLTFLGAVVGTLVLAAFLPVYQLLTTVPA